MSFLNDFEDRIGSGFDMAPQGYTEPFSFKKLAKRAAKEMEHETYEIDGVDTAPALFTVLVSSADDSLMRPLYKQITDETSDFVISEAQRKGYAFVGKPLVRFMVDPSLKSGRFAVFAENVDSKTLNRLREEEKAFLGGNSSVGGAAALVQPVGGHARPYSRGAVVPGATPLVNPMVAVSSPAASPLAPSDSQVGLDVIPDEFGAPSVVPVVPSPSSSTPMPVMNLDAVPVRQAPMVPSVDEVPSTARRATPLVNMRTSAPVQTADSGTASCLLVDRQSGRTYTGVAPSFVIGRERSQADVVLHDPNVSRRHAELSFDGRSWHIIDLHSTNGTLVNDIDIDECILRDGDLITIGLVNLEFREN